MAKRIITLILCLSMKLFAQHVHPSPEFGVTMTSNTSIPTDTYTPVSHLSYVTGTGTYSGFNVIPGGSYPVTDISSAGDGSLTLAISNTPAAHTIYKFDITASQPFIAQPQYGNSILKVAVGDATSIWALGKDQGGCSQYGSNYYPVYKWNNSNAWVQYDPGSCATDIAADGQGNGYVLGGTANNTIYVSNGTTFTQIAGTLAGAASGITVDNAGIFVATTVGGQVHVSYNNSGWSAWATLGSNIGATQVAYAQDLFLGLVLYASYPKSGSQIQIEVYANNQWNGFNNDATYSVLAAGALGAFSTNSAGTMTRYSPTAIDWAHSFKVFTTCNPSPCPSTVHKYTSTLTQLGRTSVTEASSPANTTPTVNSDLPIDPFGDPGPNDGSTDVGTCPVVGALFTVAFSSDWKTEACQATYQNINEDHCYQAPLIGYECTYDVAPYCSPATTPPDLAVTKVYNNWQLTLLPQPWGFYLEGICGRHYTNGLPDEPWIGIAGIEESLTWNPGRGNCTYHP